ncbi:MAG TPA: GNAT family protein [Devosia sp.]|jgi:ribosomal-protein-alanine N-acetyltransferase|nr:GNAT family protein [Devosia sp.]
MVWPFPPRDETPVLRGPRVLLRGPRPRDYVAWRNLRRDSREFLRPFEPRWSEADLTRRVFMARLKRGRKEAAQGTDFNFLIFLADGRREVLVGGLTLSNIRRRAAQHVTLGYWMGSKYAGNGLMTEAVSVVLPFVFNTLGLHRIHAAFLPNNIASRRVLEKNGFREEGYAENYLQIDGRWADHVMFGLTRERHDQAARRLPR